MALTDENGMVMPVSPIYGGNANSGFNGVGGDWGWIILLLLIFGWGNGFGGYGAGNNLAADGAMLYPWMNQAEITSQGFQNAQLGDQVTAIQSDLGDIQTQLCNGFAGIEQGANSRQIANMQQSFNSQTAITGAITNLAAQQANSSGENRLATCQTQNVIQNEGSQTRFANADNTRDIITNQTANTQAILDKLCQLELDGKNERISELENQLAAANLQASQSAQNALITQGFSNEVDALYNRLSSCPVPTTPVYGRTPIFTCNNGCGCSGSTL